MLIEEISEAGSCNMIFSFEQVVGIFVSFVLACTVLFQVNRIESWLLLRDRQIELLKNDIGTDEHLPFARIVVLFR